MARRQTLVQLSDELLASLDARAAKSGRSRSDLIRDAVTTYLAADREAELDRQIVDGYTRIPPGELDDWAEASLDDSLRILPW